MAPHCSSLAWKILWTGTQRGILASSPRFPSCTAAFPGLGWDENVKPSRRYTAPTGERHIKQQGDVLQNATLVGPLRHS